MYIVISYIVYLVISVNLTIWVARTLHKNGAVFLLEAFQGNRELAASVNHLLVVGFYLINLGYVALALKTGAAILSTRAAIEMVSDKIGYVMLILGGMHFFNLYVFARIRRRATGTPPPPPFAPDAMLHPVR
jgi:cytochrome c biogenesis protein CcdA